MLTYLTTPFEMNQSILTYNKSLSKAFIHMYVYYTTIDVPPPYNTVNNVKQQIPRG